MCSQQVSWHLSVENNADNTYVTIHGEVFDLMQVLQTHLRIVHVVPQKSILKYGGTVADDIFPIQVKLLFFT